METLHGFDFFALEFDRKGALVGDAFDALRQHVAHAGVTDVMLIAHGFRNNADDARELYTEFLETFRRNLERSEFDDLRSRRFAVAGVFWPSKAFRESFGNSAGGPGGGVQSVAVDSADLSVAIGELAELSQEAESHDEKTAIADALALLPRLEGNPGNQDRFVELVLSTIGEHESDPAEGLDQVKAQPGSELLNKLRFPVRLPTVGRSSDEGGVAAVGTSVGHLSASGADDGEVLGFGSFVTSLAGRVGQFLNLATWYRMKERSGTVGANGVAACVRDLKARPPQLRIHLVGHSLGGRLMASCVKALAQQGVSVDSLVLLQAAFSHFGFSRDNRAGVPGFFRPVMERNVVAGPMVATFSFQDEVVGKAYAIASRLVGDNVKAIGGPDDPFGGIGRNGAQNLSESSTDLLHPPGAPYSLQPRSLHCFDGSGGLITNHSDVRNEHVTYLVASALAMR